MLIKVLYLDDEPDLCDLFSEEFSSETVQVVTFTSPQRAMEYVKKSPPDIAFLDYRLPGTSGDKVALTMALDGPVILITGDINVNTEYLFKEVLNKPVIKEKIKKIIDNVLIEKKFMG